MSKAIDRDRIAKIHFKFQVNPQGFVNMVSDFAANQCRAMFGRSYKFAGVVP